MSILFIPIILFLLYLLEQWIYSRGWRRGLSVHLEFQSHPAAEGEQASLTEVVANRGRLPLPVLQVNFQLGRGLFVANTENVTVSDKTNMTELFSLRPRQQVTRELTLECRKRGYYRIVGNSLIAGDLFANRKYYMESVQNTEMYVYPRMMDVREVEVPFSYLMGEVRSRQLLYEDVFTFRGIRDYAPTDPMTRINWKASARTGELMVNLREYTSGQQVILLLNLEPPRVYFLQVVQEESIRYALTFAAQLLQEQIPVGMLSNGRDIETGAALRIDAGSSPSHLTVFCEGLARIDLEQEMEPFGQYLRREVLRQEEDASQGLPEPPFEAAGTASGSLPRTAEATAAGSRGDPSGTVTYVLISSSRQPETVAAARRLSRQQGRLLWLCPVTSDLGTQTSGQEDGIEMFVEVHHGT